MKRARRLFLLAAGLAPSGGAACTVCFGAKGEAVTEAAGMAILFLLGLVLCVLAGIAACVIRLAARGRRLAAGGGRGLTP